MKIYIEINESELRDLVLTAINERLIATQAKAEDVKIEVKTKTNYRAAEWEPGAFRATYSSNTP